MLDLKKLKYFIVCVETGSISEAAKLLYTTQPSVSKAIKALEEEMGIVLFEKLKDGGTLGQSVPKSEEEKKEEN